ncbi:MAG TPA: zinc ribbon domain-containing protein [Thermoplasmata archaeon]|nr:zinc ribbon domain-containing protein [Thermoplasmata archaeon]
MPPENALCAHCGAPLAPDGLVCPACHRPVDPSAEDAPVVDPREPPASRRPAARRGAATPPNPFGTELSRRLARVAQWAEAAQPLGVEMPRLPAWAEDAARAAANPEPWAEVVRGIERIAQKRIVTAFEEWEKGTKSRLARLEAYAVDSRLERDQIDDALHAARTGDVAQALATFHQVDRVITLKERHLDQAREELERVVALLKDMQALGIDPPQDPGEVAEDLETELRAGKLASLKQQIRALRLQSVNRLKAALPRYIAEYGDYLVEERAHGIATELEAMDLATGAREFFKGHPEDGLRRLRALQQRHGLPTGRSTRPTARARGAGGGA